jgi:hypothetical protein
MTLLEKVSSECIALQFQGQNAFSLIVFVAEIIADIRRRVSNPRSWMHGKCSKKIVKSKSPTPAKSIPTMSKEVGLNDIVLSLFDNTYRVSLSCCHYFF